MASTNSKECDICTLRHLSVPAVIWCPECDESLCNTCKEYHDLSRLSKGHQSISVEEYTKLPPIIREAKQYCSDHNERFDFFCPEHKTLCCRKCVTSTHNQCGHFISTDDVIESTIKSPSLSQNLGQNLECQIRNLAIARKDREGNIKLISEQNDKFRADIKNVRAKVNEHLDQLEKKLIDELDYTVELQTKEIESVINEINEKQQVVKDMKASLLQIDDKPVNLQTFLGMRNLGKIATQSETFVNDLINSPKFDRVNVEMSISNEMSLFLSKIKSVGTVRVVTRPRTISTMNWKESQAHVFALPKMIRSNMKLILSTKVQAPKGKAGINITGCAISSSGQIFIADFSPSKRILTLDIDGTFKKDVNFVDNSVYDVTCIDPDIVALSSGSYREIKLLNTTTQRITSKARTPANNYGLTSTNGTLIYSLGNLNVQSLNLSDDVKSDIQTDKLKNNTYICYSEGFLYHTGSDGASVVCSNMSGKTHWTFHCEQLKKPRGISIDGQGQVYVVGEASNNVIGITADGSEFTEILTKADELNKPTAICCDKKNNILVICNKGGGIFVYKIQQHGQYADEKN